MDYHLEESVFIVVPTVLYWKGGIINTFFSIHRSLKTLVIEVLKMNRSCAIHYLTNKSYV